MTDMPSLTEDQARALAERLRQQAEDRNLPYAAFYFTYMAEHFAAAARKTGDIRPERASPFVYTMQ